MCPKVSVSLNFIFFLSEKIPIDCNLFVFCIQTFLIQMIGFYLFFEKEKEIVSFFLLSLTFYRATFFYFCSFWRTIDHEKVWFDHVKLVNIPNYKRKKFDISSNWMKWKYEARENRTIQLKWIKQRKMFYCYRVFILLFFAFSLFCLVYVKHMQNLHCATKRWFSFCILRWFDSWFVKSWCAHNTRMVG